MGHEGADRELLVLVIGPGTCPTCLNLKSSRLHRELCPPGPRKENP